MDELLAAVADCDTETIAECLDAGADLHHVGLIHEAVSTDDMQVVTLLLGRGAQVNQRDANGRTPLHCAQSRGVAAVLLRSGADVTARDASGQGCGRHQQQARLRPGAGARDEAAARAVPRSPTSGDPTSKPPRSREGGS